MRPGSSRSSIVSESGKNYSVTLWLLEEEVRGEKTQNIPTDWSLRKEQGALDEIIPQVWIHYI